MHALKKIEINEIEEYETEEVEVILKLHFEDMPTAVKYILSSNLSIVNYENEIKSSTKGLCC